MKSIEEMKRATANCKRCAGTGWVCGEHRDKPWSGVLPKSVCGCNEPGDPCPDCNGLAKMSEATFSPAERQRRQGKMTGKPRGLVVMGSKAGGFYVADDMGGHGTIVAGFFETNAEAWRALDRLQNEPINKREDLSDWSFRKSAHGE